MQFTIIGNPENRRVISFCDTIQRLGYAHLVIAYEEWLSGKVDPSVIKDSFMKIDSPGENDAVRQLFIARGMNADTSGWQPLSSKADHGIIRHMPAWYAGYCSWLNDIQSTIRQHSPVWVMNTPADIALHFDKPQCL